MRWHSWCSNPLKTGKIRVRTQLGHLADPSHRGGSVLGEPASVSLSLVAGSPKGDGPAGQDSWLPVGPIRMAGGPSELRVWSSKVQFPEDPALKILSAVAWTQQGKGPAQLEIKLPVTSMRRKHHQNWVRFAVDGSQRNQPQLSQCLQ